MRPLKEKISITIDSDLLIIIKDEAEKDERSLSQYINMVLRQHVNKKCEEYSEKILVTSE